MDAAGGAAGIARGIARAHHGHAHLARCDEGLAVGDAFAGLEVAHLQQGGAHFHDGFQTRAAFLPGRAPEGIAAVEREARAAELEAALGPAHGPGRVGQGALEGRVGRPQAVGHGRELFQLAAGEIFLFRHVGTGEVRDGQGGLEAGAGAQAFQQGRDVFRAEAQAAHARIQLDGHAPGIGGAAQGGGLFQGLETGDEGRQAAGAGLLPVFIVLAAQQGQDGLGQAVLAQADALCHGAHGKMAGAGGVQGVGHFGHAVTVGIGFDDRHESVGPAHAAEVADKGSQADMTAGRGESAAHDGSSDEKQGASIAALSGRHKKSLS